MKSKEEYIRAMQEKLEEWNADIDVLMAKGNEVSAELKSDYAEQVESLKTKQAVARQKIDELQKSGEGAWEDLKTGLDLAWRVIGEAVDSAKSRFK